MPETMTAEEYRALKTDKPTKYRSKKTEVDGIRFDSKREGERYAELKLLERSGDIRELELQPSFSFKFNGVHICDYIADFAYSEDGRKIVEDVKSEPTKTPEYRIKKKLMAAFHGIEIKEVA